MTNLMRLQLELNNQPYLEESDLRYLLEENGLEPDEGYTKADRLKLLSAVLAVFQVLENDVDFYRQVETEFATTGEAFLAMRRRITQIKAEISQLEVQAEMESGCVTYLFRGRC